MARWWRKIAVVFITILTLGIYTPTNLLEVDADKRANSSVSSSSDIDAASAAVDTTQSYIIEDPREAFLENLHEEAKTLSIAKFGPRIADKLEDEFTVMILPQMEIVLADLVEQSAMYKDVAITEKPSEGYGERIFNVSNNSTNETLAKFHVRRENRPLEGYYFNFHYHLSEDGFQKHYHMGDIYWNKNTPPKWMA
ncbi:YpjP family protein [Oceanobacillus jeddahense]|uniref:YpjP family protein n=1 Tax=Oceanobacillus jeddahense TaxID=1462527 RepID=A0ABY5JR50_9BACI|nr:YpjP family protein [Oceanobacillus jeddahense]UUI02788.1 YpjP family protein [Oceanobacillus jeddahense]